MSKRIDINIDEELYRRLEVVKNTYGFKSLRELNIAMLNILVTHVEAAEARPSLTYMDAAEEISEMFNELSYWQRTPDGTVPKRGHKKGIDS